MPKGIPNKTSNKTKTKAAVAKQEPVVETVDEATAAIPEVPVVNEVDTDITTVDAVVDDSSTLLRVNITSNDPDLNQAPACRYTIGNSSGVETYNIFFGVESILPKSVIDFLEDQTYTPILGNIANPKEMRDVYNPGTPMPKFNIIKMPPMEKEEAEQWLQELKEKTK